MKSRGSVGKVVVHPALLRDRGAFGARRIAQAIEEGDRAELESVPGWEHLTEEQKDILTVLPWFGTVEQACEYLHKSVGWYKAQRARGGAQGAAFRAAVEMRRGAPVRVVRHFAAEMLGMAILRHREILKETLSSQRVKPKEMLEAIQMVYVINGMDKPEAAVLGNQYINTTTVQYFEGGERKGAPVAIEGAARVIEDDEEEVKPLQETEGWWNKKEAGR